MQLENDIIQSLDRLNARLKALLGNFAMGLGLSQTQAMIILLINSGIDSVSKIADELSVTSATISDSVKSLRAKNFVTATENIRDSRGKILAFTEDGQKIAAKLLGHTNKLTEKLSGMHMSEKAMLLEGLQNLSAKFS